MKINKKVLKNILALSKNAYPSEVGGLLLGKEIIDDFVLVPAEFTTHSVYVKLYDIPIYPNLAGSFHSHPVESSEPSSADLRFFGKMGKVHIIFAYPYDLNSFIAYDSEGKQVKLEVV